MILFDKRISVFLDKILEALTSFNTVHFYKFFFVVSLGNVASPSSPMSPMSGNPGMARMTVGQQQQKQQSVPGMKTDHFSELNQMFK